MKKLKLVLILVLVMGVLSVAGMAKNCPHSSSFYWERKADNEIKFIPCEPEKFDYYKWSFGDDGFYATHQDFVKHVYLNSGTFRVRMKARNNYGNWITSFREIKITSSQERNVEASVGSFAERVGNLSLSAKLGIGVGAVLLVMLM